MANLVFEPQWLTFCLLVVSEFNFLWQLTHCLCVITNGKQHFPSFQVTEFVFCTDPRPNPICHLKLLWLFEEYFRVNPSKLNNCETLHFSHPKIITDVMALICLPHYVCVITCGDNLLENCRHGICAGKAGKASATMKTVMWVSPKRRFNYSGITQLPVVVLAEEE